MASEIVPDIQTITMRQEKTRDFSYVDLQLGWPSLSLCPQQELHNAMTAVISGASEVYERAIAYGSWSGPRFLREALAAWLTEFYRPAAGPLRSKHIFIANGASSALSIILDRFTDPIYTRRIWMMEPVYFNACPIFEDAGFAGRLRGIPEDNEGIDLTLLQQAIEEHEKSDPCLRSGTYNGFKIPQNHPKLFRYVIYVVPTFNNPTGNVMSLKRRKELVLLARKYDALVIADDVYDMLRWPVMVRGGIVAEDIVDAELPPPLPRLIDIDSSMATQTEFGNCCSNGTFSKIVTPGIRVSWIEGSLAFVQSLQLHGSTRSGGCPSQMLSFAMFNMLRNGNLSKHLHSIVLPTYQKRYITMLRAIKLFLEPLGVRLVGGMPKPFTEDGSAPSTSEVRPCVMQAGGFFCFVEFPDDLPDASSIAELALNSYGIKIAPSQMMIVKGDSESVERYGGDLGRCARLCWSWHEAHEIQTGVKIIAKVIEDLRTGTPLLPLLKLPDFGSRFD